ncbi:MAG: hypothetical protein K0R84_2018 [Clostridia bacterium]|nr:hypothetical protein [Clostridia bacterium]
MCIREFKKSMSLIINFVTKMDEEKLPSDIKKAMVKVYANTLSINLTDRMVDSITEAVAV